MSQGIRRCLICFFPGLKNDFLLFEMLSIFSAALYFQQSVCSTLCAFQEFISDFISELPDSLFKNNTAFE